MSANDPNTIKPVALLGRPGPARDRLREAISLAGARIIFEDEPVMVSAAQLLAAKPEAIIVALDPVIEEALEPLERVFKQPGMIVLFDDAEVAARREGWIAQRWIRHLSAKLYGHTNVLPSRLRTEPLPVSTALGIGQLSSPKSYTAANDQLEVHLTPHPVNSKIPASRPISSYSDAPLPNLTSDPVGQANRLSNTDVSLPRSPLPSQPIATGDHRPRDPTDSAGQSTMASFSLAASPPSAQPSPQTGGSVQRQDFKMTRQHPQTIDGVVVVLAGVGGMDALRRFFSALPHFFLHPILIAMTLDTVQCSHLIRQMQRVCQYPVSLAAIGDVVRKEQVFVLPSDIGCRVQLSQLVFDRFQSLTTWLQSIPVRHSAILMLSGASTAAVATVLSLRAKGVWVAGQSPIGCYEPTAASQLILHGCPSGDPASLATELASHLPANEPQVRRQ